MGSWLTVLVAGALLAAPSDAHVLYGRPTLGTLARGADAVALVEITAAATPWVSGDQRGRCDALAARVLETLTADPLSPEIEFFLHSEGDPRFSVGDRVLLFLERSDRRPEFAPMKERFPYYSAQGPGQEWRVDGPFGEARRNVAAAWLAAGEPPAIRQVLLAQLASGDSGLQEDAIFELVRARSEKDFFASETDVAPFAALLEEQRLTPSQARALRSLLAPYRRQESGTAAGEIAGLEPSPSP